MATPLSLSPTPLTDLGSASYKTLLEDDYSVNKLNLKAKASTKNGGVVNYKGSTTLSVFDGKES